MTADVAAFAAACAAGTLSDADADRWMLQVTGGSVDVLGAQLHEGSVVVDVAGCGHRIDHFRDYPGAFKGDHARRAYEHADEHGWCATVCDHEPFHVQPEGEQP